MNETASIKALNYAAVEYVNKSVALTFDGAPVVECVDSIIDFVKERWVEFWKLVGKAPSMRLRVSFPEFVSEEELSFVIRGVEIGVEGLAEERIVA